MESRPKVFNPRLLSYTLISGTQLLVRAIFGSNN